MRVFLPNSANLQNITALLTHIDFSNPHEFHFSMHPRWVAVHPVALAMTACLAANFREGGGKIQGAATEVPTLPYLIRMGLFAQLGIDPGKKIVEHDEAGRFIPLTRIQTKDDLKQAIVNLVPLLHAPASVAEPIKYVFSEMVRNCIEHSNSDSGAFICAQYYRKSRRIAIGIADSGVGVFESMRRSHKVANDKDAILLALQPGITGATSRIGGNEYNAGAGLFFTKSIATLSRNRFFIYSGDTMFRLMKTRLRREPQLEANPLLDPHTIAPAPRWPGTVVGIDISIDNGISFSELLNKIRGAYHIDVRKRKDYSNRIRFGP